MIRIMTYNVRGLKDDRSALRRVITQVAPDVLLLQEVPRHPFSDHRVAAFAESVGMLWSGGVRHRMSTTLLTAPRLDVHRYGHGLYSVPRPQEPRGYAWAEVSLSGGGHLVVVSTHMSLYTSLRGPHIEELMADESIPGSWPWVVGGDLNELAGGPATSVLARSMRDVGSRAFTSPAVNPVKRIDFIYAGSDVHAEPVGIPASGEDLERATDHRPVVVDVEPDSSVG